MKRVGGHRYRVGDLTNHYLDDEEGEGQEDHAGETSRVGEVATTAEGLVSMAMTVIGAVTVTVSVPVAVFTFVTFAVTVAMRVAMFAATHLVSKIGGLGKRRFFLKSWVPKKRADDA